MKISEAITALEACKAKHGDLPLKDEDFYGVGRIVMSELDGKRWAIFETVYDRDLPKDEL